MEMPYSIDTFMWVANVSWSASTLKKVEKQKMENISFVLFLPSIPLALVLS